MKRYTVAVLLVGALACTDSNAPSPPAVPPPPPPPAASFAIRPALDTVIVGELVTFVTSDGNLGLVTEWSLSDSALAQFGPHDYQGAWVTTRAAGTVTITASHGGGDTARATLVIREPQPGEWESIDLGLVDSAYTAAATAIADDGTIIGYLGYLGSCLCWRGFIYKDGAMRQLPSRGGSDLPQVIGPSGKIADNASVWDTPDALPRQLPLGPNEMGGVVGVNQRGDVLFTATTRFAGCDASPSTCTDRSRAVLWRDDVSVDLGSLGDSTVDPWAEAKSWNTKGQIVGGSRLRNRDDHGYLDEFYHPFLWENGVMRDLGVLAPFPCLPGSTAADCSWGEAVDINANGVIVGNANGAEGQSRAVIWENGFIRDLGVDPGHYTIAVAINDRGQVLGRSQTYGDFLWDNGEVQSIGLGLYATALGPNGEVIGWSATFSRNHAFFWQAGQLADLGEGAARGINSRGEVVGFSGRRAMLWRKKR